jgi:hypothetical protein
MVKKMNAGIACDLTQDENILAINSPKGQVGGPYKVVYKSTDEANKWAIVALDWNGGPCLGIRWFHGAMGNPVSTGHPIWFIIPDPLNNAILDCVTQLQAERIKQFLEREISGEEL